MTETSEMSLLERIKAVETALTALRAVILKGTVPLKGAEWAAWTALKQEALVILDDPRL